MERSVSHFGAQAALALLKLRRKAVGAWFPTLRALKSCCCGRCSFARSLSHLAVHNPIPKWHGLISGVAFPYSPPEIDRGPVYEFHLNHVLVPDSPTALFRTEYEEV